jgi:hypothetical protein
MLENIANKVVTNLSDNISSVSTFTERRWCSEQAYHPNFDRIEMVIILQLAIRFHNIAYIFGGLDPSLRLTGEPSG